MLVKPHQLQKGDQVALISLSSGVLGEKQVLHERKLGEKRLKELGLKFIYMPNSLKGTTYLKKHPNERANDLKEAFMNPEIKAIIAAIGGDDTYRLLPYLMEDSDFIKAVQTSPKLFTGFSDTTNNHLMFYRLGMQSFYGPNFLNDLAELDVSMLEYTLNTWNHFFINPPTTNIPASQTWYEERTDFSPKAINHPRISHRDTGYQVLRGNGIIQGRLWGGCLDSLYGDLTQYRYPDQAEIIRHYRLILSPQEAQNIILFIETSEECPSPDLYAQMLNQLDQAGLLKSVRGILMGKPQNNCYVNEYQTKLLAATAKYQTPILANVNIGHAYPHTALPYGALAQINLDQSSLKILEPYFS
ncbi:LD-carboxypeptidase [Lactobacillus sp. ESL0233]|uniref:S66 family peptidase n=1 Tax=Lactobacillus sp. ESL0233 TaxID=2069354 RepID=UPI000EFB875C|nr:S66 peptidase family protein [Lactobacillus sp. ESL0233]RMC40062.1 LD-carboxypeptidase [Lactobacillus sp. ESL0233]